MKKLLPLSIVFYLFAFNAFAQSNVGIGTPTPDPSAIVEMQSTTQGMLIPRVTTAQRLAIGSPANSLMVYDADLNCFYFYSTPLAQWVSMCTLGVTGATGSAGVAGPAGVAGVTGNIGSTGAVGATGVGLAGPTGTVGATGPVGCTTNNYLVKSTGPGATCSIINDNGTQVGVATLAGYRIVDVAGDMRLTLAGVSLTTNNAAQLELSNGGSGNANMTFNNTGVWGANLGLDNDNRLSTRGFSAITGFTNFKAGAIMATPGLNGIGSILFNDLNGNGIADNLTSEIILSKDATNSYLYPYGTGNTNNTLFIGSSVITNLSVNGAIRSYGGNIYLDGIVNSSGYKLVFADVNGTLVKGSVPTGTDKPIYIQRFTCSCDNPTRNTTVSTTDYTAVMVGFNTNSNGASNSTTSIVYQSGGTWWFHGDEQGPNENYWYVDIMFIRNYLVNDLRPTGTYQGAATAF